MLVVDLGKWMNKILIDWGIDAKVADRFDETIIAILMIAIAVGVDYLCQAILVGGMRQYTRRKPHLRNTLLMKRKVFHNLIHTIPAILVYALLPMAFMRGKELLVISQKACAIYIIFSLLLMSIKIRSLPAAVSYLLCHFIVCPVRILQDQNEQMSAIC